MQVGPTSQKCRQTEAQWKLLEASVINISTVLWEKSELKRLRTERSPNNQRLNWPRLSCLKCVSGVTENIMLLFSHCKNIVRQLTVCYTLYLILQGSFPYHCECTRWLLRCRDSATFLPQRPGQSQQWCHTYQHTACFTRNKHRLSPKHCRKQSTSEPHWWLWDVTLPSSPCNP